MRLPLAVIALGIGESSMGNMMGALASFGQDSSVLKKRVKSGTAKRTIAFAALYAWLLALFLLVVIASASISIANPLIRVKPSKNAQRFRIELRKKVRTGRLVKVLSILGHATDVTANSQGFFEGGRGQRHHLRGSQPGRSR